VGLYSRMTETDPGHHEDRKFSQSFRGVRFGGGVARFDGSACPEDAAVVMAPRLAG
jgi:hypothetical protein